MAITQSEQPQSPDQEQYFSTFFCRALYDYQTDNESSLSFHKDDIIEVLTRLDSGWWDGLLGQERGWFPSNYVTTISDQEADAALSAAEAAANNFQPHNDYDNIDITHSLTASSSQSSQEWEQHVHLDTSLPSYDDRNDRQIAPTPVMSSDFWVPQVSVDGRVRLFSTL